MSSLIGLNTLSNNLPAFIVTTREILVRQYLALLPADKVIAEIPDNVSADAEVVRACKRLKESGGKIALSNFRADDPRRGARGHRGFSQSRHQNVYAGRCGNTYQLLSRPRPAAHR
jgi:hypothetical protein